jgi:hypothetical protein
VTALILSLIFTALRVLEIEPTRVHMNSSVSSQTLKVRHYLLPPVWQKRMPQSFEPLSVSGCSSRYPWAI